MIAALTQLLLLQLLGEVIARWLELPVPGPVLGMLFLFLTLAVRGGPGHELQSTSQHLLQHLSLLFVPAGTGVMLHVAQIESEWLPIAVALVVSTVLAIAVSAVTFQWLLRRREGPANAGLGDKTTES